MEVYPLQFSKGKSRLILQPGAFSSGNQQPITCVNNIYKWFILCVQSSLDSHLNEYDLMEVEQRGAKAGCSGTTNNRLIDKMVTQDCHQGKCRPSDSIRVCPLCPRLFTLCLNPVAWQLKATEGYRLSKPIGTKVTHLLYVDDLKVFTSS